MRTVLSLVVVVGLGGTAGAQAPATQPAAVQRSLSLDEALRLAEQNHPEVRAARGEQSGAEAQALGARAPLLPQVDGSARYTLSGSTLDDTEFHPEDVLRYGASASMLIWDFKKTVSLWYSAKENAGAAAERTVQTLKDVRRDVRLAFFQLRAARELIGVARETQANEQRHLAQIEGFVEVGRRPRVDLYESRTGVANARLSLIRAENDAASAKVNLIRAIGVPMKADFDVADESMPPVAEESLPGDDVVALAIKDRPEVAAAFAERRAAELTVRGVSRGTLPFVRAVANLDGTTLDDPVLPRDRTWWAWDVGLELVWPIFNGFATRADTKQAEAQVFVADARIEGLRQSIRAEVENALLAVRGARAAEDAATEALTAARERYRLAEGRYAEGVGTSLELSDAQIEVTRAGAELVRARFDLAAARAELLHALGAR